MRNRRHWTSRIERVEAKCDRILSELSVIRRSLNAGTNSVDDAIERMHRNARRMRAETEKNARILRELFLTK